MTNWSPASRARRIRSASARRAPVSAHRPAEKFQHERLALVKQDLDTAAQRLALFKTENKYIDLEQQTKSSVEALAQFEAQDMALDLEIGQLQSRFGAGNQRIAELQKEKSVVRKNINEFMASGGGNLIIALKDAPEKAVRYGYLLRDAKIQESLYEFVLQLCEQSNTVLPLVSVASSLSR